MEGPFNRFRTAIEVAMVVYIVMLSRNYVPLPVLWPSVLPFLNSSFPMDL